MLTNRVSVGKQSSKALVSRRSLVALSLGCLYIYVYLLWTKSVEFNGSSSSKFNAFVLEVCSRDMVVQSFRSKVTLLHKTLRLARNFVDTEVVRRCSLLSGGASQE